VPIFNAAIKVLRDFVGMSEPCLAPQLVPACCVLANDYNPNVVAPPEMRLLHLSIQQDGLTQPVVAYELGDGKHETVDGFHRRCVVRGEDRDGRPVKEWADIPARLRGYAVVVHIDKPLEERKASTVRHNRARGKHGVGPMSEMVQELYGAGWSDARICEHLGMEPDEVLRLRQVGGLADLFAHEDFSEAWEPI
jgi:ParB-like chromosome segregation protein Spo0J